MGGSAILRGIFWFGIAFNMSFLCQLYWWRKGFPLSKRQPFMIIFQVILLGILGSFVLIFPGFYDIEVISCLKYNVPVISVFYAVFLSVLLRVVYLWNLDFQTFLVNKFHGMSSENGEPQKKKNIDWSGVQFWYFKNRKVFGLPLLYLVAALAELDIIVNTYMHYMNHGADNIHRGSPECRKIFGAGSKRDFFFVRWIFFSTLLFCLLYNLRKLQDNFGLIKEVKAAIGMMTATIIYFLVGGQVQQIYTNQFHYFLFGFLMESIWLILVMLPLIVQSCRWSREHFLMLQESAKSRDDVEADSSPRTPASFHETLGLLDRVLRNPAGFDLMYQFLQNEFALENILFWKATEDFLLVFDTGFTTTKLTNDELTETTKSFITGAESLMHNYINPEALMCVNLSSGCRSATIQKFQDMQAFSTNTSQEEYGRKSKAFISVLVKAENEVLKMTATDSFLRFRETQAFKEFALQHLAL
jgi:hypothetical protein